MTSRFLCQGCNSRFGHGAEAMVKFDPSIRTAIGRLREEIPGLARRLMEGQLHRTHGNGPSVQAYMRDGEFKVSPAQLDDGSLILPPDESPNAIARMLKRDGLDQVPIERALEALESIPENERVTIAPGLDVINWSFSKVDLDRSRDTLLDPVVPLKIAFEFLALCVGEEIYGAIPPLSHIRSILRRVTDWDERTVSVDRLCAPRIAPFHGICNESNAEYESVQIRLFGQLAYRVHFRKLRIDCPRFVYTHLLNDNVDHVRVVE